LAAGGPHRYGETVYLGLSCLVHPASNDPARRMQPGAIAIFDSTAGTLTPLGQAELPAALYAGAIL
jgi:hypothetical protein